MNTCAGRFLSVRLLQRWTPLLTASRSQPFFVRPPHARLTESWLWGGSTGSFSKMLALLVGPLKTRARPPLGPRLLAALRCRPATRQTGFNCACILQVDTCHPCPDPHHPTEDRPRSRSRCPCEPCESDSLSKEHRLGDLRAQHGD